MHSTLAELRSHPGRFAAVIVSVVLGVAFAAASLVLTAGFGKALARSVGADVSRADVVVTATGDTLDLDRLARVPGVFSAEPVRTAYVGYSGTAGRGALDVRNIPVDPGGRWYSLAAGRWPSGAAELAVDRGTATRNNWVVGSVVVLGSPPSTATVTVTALLDTSLSPVAGATDSGYSSLDLLTVLDAGPAVTATVVVAAGENPAHVAAAIDAAMAGSTESTTAAAVTRDRVHALSGDTDVLAVLLGAFVALAGLVAAMVISTTFTITLTARRRQIGLLRCVGATTRQVRRSLLAQAAVLAALGTVLGLGVGVGIGRLACTVVGIGAADISIEPGPLVAVGAAGVLITLLAAMAPLARATRIPPLAALRPVEPDEQVRRAGRVRVVAGGGLVLAGGAGLTGGIVLPDFAVATGGGGIAAIGVLLLLRVTVPAALRLVSVAGGRVAGSRGLFGPAGRLAVDNARRNPTRAAATCTALVVGVGAVVTLLVAASSAQAGADRAAAASNPLDLALSVDSGVLPDSLLPAVRAVPGIATAVVVPGTAISVYGTQYQAFGPSADQLAAVLNAGPLQRGQVALPSYLVAQLGLAPGDPVTLTRGSSTVRLSLAGHAVTDDGSIVVLAPDLLRLDPRAPAGAVWAKFDADAAPDEVMAKIHPLLGPLPQLSLSGSGIQRAATADTLSTIIRVVLGLLACAVVISLVGIGSTLSLSVAERTRESALLRALGLRRRQLRRMLGVEAGLLAVVAAVVGVAVGTIFGWAAVAAAFRSAGRPVVLSVPWGQLLMVVAGTLLAGILASVLPARRAAKATPIQALVEV